MNTAEWNPDDWDGLTEEQAFAEDPASVIRERGTLIASQAWSCGSGSEVYEYKGRYHAFDDAEAYDRDTALEAFKAAGILNDQFDPITYTRVAPTYRHLLDELKW